MAIASSDDLIWICHHNGLCFVEVLHPLVAQCWRSSCCSAEKKHHIFSCKNIASDAIWMFSNSDLLSFEDFESFCSFFVFSRFLGFRLETPKRVVFRFSRPEVQPASEYSDHRPCSRNRTRERKWKCWKCSYFFVKNYRFSTLCLQCFNQLRMYKYVQVMYKESREWNWPWPQSATRCFFMGWGQSVNFSCVKPSEFPVMAISAATSLCINDHSISLVPKLTDSRFAQACSQVWKCPNTWWVKE